MTPTDIVKSFQVFMASGDFPQAFALIAEDAVWHSDEIGAPWSGIHVGKAHILQHFSAISGTTLNFSRKIDDHIEKNDLVIEIGSLSCILKKTGTFFETGYVCIYKVSNDKIYSYRIFEDSLKLSRAYFPDP